LITIWVLSVIINQDSTHNGITRSKMCQNPRNITGQAGVVVTLQAWHLYSRLYRLKSPPGHRLHRRFSWFCTVPPSEFPYSIPTNMFRSPTLRSLAHNHWWSSRLIWY
jgi:hypothetical protein